MRQISPGLNEMVVGLSPVSIVHDAFEAVSVGMVMLDLDGRIRYANRAYCDIYGFSEEALLGRNFLELKHPEDRAETEAMLAALQSGVQDSFQHESRSLRKDGTTLWLHVSASLLRARDGHPHALMAVITDVTRQHMAEAAHRELHREREALLDSSGEGIYGVDLSGDCTFVNGAAAEMLGYTRDELLGVNMHALVHAKHPDGTAFPADECAIVQAFRRPGSGRLRNHEQTLWRKDGSPVQIEHSAEPVVVDGQVRGSVVTLRDVTARNARTAERQRLLEQERWLREHAARLDAALREASKEQIQLLEAIPQMVWVTGPAGEPQFVSERWRTYTGIGALAEQPPAWLMAVHPEDRERTGARFRSSLRTTAPFEMEHRMQCADGSYRWVLAKARPLLDDAGQVVRWFGISTDVHDGKTTEDMLRRAEKQAAAGRLAATVAHEINNPLEAVGNLLYLALQDPELPPLASRYMQMASDELQRVGRIANQALGFYRESSTKQPVDLADLVTDVLSLFQRKLNARQIRVSRSLESGVVVEGIAGELRQVVANLTSNAIDAMETYGVFGVEVRSDMGEAVLAITDTGHGIPTPLLSHIFEPFFTTKQDSGTGLGLWVSKGIVAKHHGRLEVTSSQAGHDHGTCFLLTLPRAEAGADAGIAPKAR